MDNPFLFLKNHYNYVFSTKTNKKLSKFIAIIIIILLLIYYYWKCTRIVSENKDSRISILLYVTYLTLNIILIIVCFFNIFMGHDTLSRFTKNISHVDFLSQNLEISYKDTVNTYINYKQILLIIITTASFIIFYYLALTDNDFPSIDFTEIVCIPLVWLLIFQINSKLNQISRRFNHIKKILETYMENPSNIYWIHWKTIGPKEIITLNCMHLFTYLSFLDVSSYYNIQLLVLVPRVIYYNVLPVHYNIVTALVADERNTSHTWSQIFTMSIIILTIWPVIHLVRCASKTIEKV